MPSGNYQRNPTTNCPFDVNPNVFYIHYENGTRRCYVLPLNAWLDTDDERPEKFTARQHWRERLKNCDLPDSYKHKPTSVETKLLSIKIIPDNEEMDFWLPGENLEEPSVNEREGILAEKTPELKERMLAYYERMMGEGYKSPFYSLQHSVMGLKVHDESGDGKHGGYSVERFKRQQEEEARFMMPNETARRLAIRLVKIIAAKSPIAKQFLEENDFNPSVEALGTVLSNVNEFFSDEDLHFAELIRAGETEKRWRIDKTAHVDERLKVLEELIRREQKKTPSLNSKKRVNNKKKKARKQERERSTAEYQLEKREIIDRWENEMGKVEDWIDRYQSICNTRTETVLISMRWSMLLKGYAHTLMAGRNRSGDS